MAEGEPQFTSEQERYLNLKEQFEAIQVMMEHEGNSTKKIALAELLLALHESILEEVPEDLIGDDIAALRGNDRVRYDEQWRFMESFLELQQQIDEEQNPWMKTALARRLIAASAAFETPDPDDLIGLDIAELDKQLGERLVIEKYVLPLLLFSLLFATPQEGETLENVSGGYLTDAARSSWQLIFALLLLGSISGGDWLQKYGKRELRRMHVPRNLV